MNKTLITFFTVLFCLTSSVGLTEQTSKNEKNKSLAKDILNLLKNSEVIKKHNKIKERNKNFEDNYKTIKKYSNIIKNHISKNWIISIGLTGSKIEIFPMQISLNPDGSVVDVMYVGNKVIISNKDKSIINSIKIAIQKSSPLPIPINKYNLFKKFILDFDLSFPIPK